MNNANKKTIDFESKFIEGYNRGFELNSKIPIEKSKETQEYLKVMKDSKPNDIILSGFSSGFSDALHFDKIKRLSQIKDIEQPQYVDKTQER